MVDRELNYGREQMLALAKMCPSPRNVLDLGAGFGTDLFGVQKLFPSCELHAVECYAEYARKLRSSGVQVHPLNLEHDSLPFASSSVDLILANQVLEHTKEIFWIFHEISRVLPVSGHVLIGVPNLASLHNRALLLLGRQPTSIQTASAHIRGFTRHDLLRFVYLCFPKGFELVAWKGSNFYPFPAALARPLAALFPGMAYSMFLLLRKVRPYDTSFIEFPRREKLETNYYLGHTELPAPEASPYI